MLELVYLEIKIASPLIDFNIMRLTEALRMIWQCRWSHCMKIHCRNMYNTVPSGCYRYRLYIYTCMYNILGVKQGQLVKNEYTVIEGDGKDICREHYF